jgi:hypothetical protein
MTISAKELRKAAGLKERIDALQNKLDQILGEATVTQAVPTPGKRRVSAVGRARMRAAQKRRWAKLKGATATAPKTKGSRRKMSAAGRARLSALAKARWKVARAQGRGTL